MHETGIDWTPKLWTFMSFTQQVARAEAVDASGTS